MFRPFRIALLAWFATIGILGTASAAQPTYQFGVVPQFEPRKLSAIWSPIIDELEKRTGFKLVMAGSARIPEFEGEFEAGRYDFAYMNPYHALVAMRGQKYEPLVRDSSQPLFGIVVTARDGPVRQVSDLAGKTVAFPAPNALGASLLVRAELERKYGVTVSPLWAQTHSSAYLKAALGRVAAAGGVMATFSQQPQSVRDRLRIVLETRRVAPHPVMAHPRVPAADRDKMRQAFLDLATSAEGRALLAAIPMPAPVAAHAGDYRELTELGLERYYVKGGD
jgi:phosphonate transport system substrate-binding protein